MILRRVHPEPGEPIDTAEPDCRLRLQELYQPDADTWLRLNLVHSVDGSARGADGTSHELSSSADRAVLGAIRSLSDIVLIGAETLRAESYLLPTVSRLAVLTGSGDLTGAKTKQELPPDRILVLGPASAEERARETFVTEFTFVGLPETGDERLDPHAVVAALREHGAPRIVCEGGPHLAQQLLRAGIVDELCLTTSPKLVGGAFPVLGSEPLDERDLALHQLLVDDAGSIYARWFTQTS